MNDIHGYVGAYVTNALDDELRTVFAEHLDGCESCSREVREFGETLAELSSLSATPPPAALKRDVLAAVARTRIEPPPLSEEERDAGEVGGAGEVGNAGEPGSGDPRSGGGSGSRTARDERDRASRAPRWLTLAVAAALLIAVVLGGWSVLQQRRISDLERAQQAQQARSDLLQAPDLRAYPVDLKDGSHGTYLVSRDQDRALLVATMPEAAPGRDYQLWSMEGGTPVPGSVFDGGQVQLWVNGVDRTEGFAITIEPDGGSAKPTLPIQAQTVL